MPLTQDKLRRLQARINSLSALANFIASVSAGITNTDNREQWDNQPVEGRQLYHEAVRVVGEAIAALETAGAGVPTDSDLMFSQLKQRVDTAHDIISLTNKMTRGIEFLLLGKFGDEEALTDAQKTNIENKLSAARTSLASLIGQLTA